MNVGISLLSGQQPIDTAMVAQKAEALGFDSLWVGEHPIMPVRIGVSKPLFCPAPPPLRCCVARARDGMLGAKAPGLIQTPFSRQSDLKSSS